MRRLPVIAAICMACALSAHAVVEDSVSGTVKAVRFSSLQTAPATLLVTDNRGDEVEFTVKAHVVIYSDEVGMKMSLKDLAQGTRVIVQYEKTPEGFLAATSIKAIRPQPMAGGRER